MYCLLRQKRYSGKEIQYFLEIITPQYIQWTILTLLYMYVALWNISLVCSQFLLIRATELYLNCSPNVTGCGDLFKGLSSFSRRKTATAHENGRRKSGCGIAFKATNAMAHGPLYAQLFFILIFVYWVFYACSVCLFFFKFFQECHQSFKQFGPRPGPTICRA